MHKQTAVLILVLALGLGACGYDSTDYNQVGLIYSGGVVEDAEYQGQLKQGANNNSVGFGSEVYKYPVDQRSWIASTDEEERDTEPVTVVSSDEQRMIVEYQLYFTLNQEEETLRKFHENIGLKEDAWTFDGWKKMLRTYFDPQIERSLEAAALQFEWKDLYANEDTRRAFQAETVARAKTAITEVVGGDYFCAPDYTGEGDCGDMTFTVGKPTPANQSLVDAIEAEQTSVQETIAQEQENARIRAELEARADEVELYGPEVYAWLQAIAAARDAGVAPPPFFGGQSVEPRVDVPVDTDG